MAYNLQSLITILEQILNPKQTRWIVDHNKPQLQSLLQKAESMQQILEICSLTKIETIESEIRDASHKAEDIIESHFVHQMLYNTEGVSFTFITPDLQQVMQELDSVMEQVVKLSEVKTTSSGVDLTSKRIIDEDHSVQSKAVVGVDEDLRQLTDRVMGMQSKLEIVPIVGMGGIGKTTLARKLYHDPAILEHFTSLAWATVSQDYNMQAILLSLLRCVIGKETDQYIRKDSNERNGIEREQHAEEENQKLKDVLYRSLYGRRYMIVLDDIWNIRFWGEIRKYLPNTSNGSRIVVTTRETEVAKYINSHSKQHEMQLLNESESWDLLRQEVFGDEEDCPAALEKIGRNIARNCGGLPLAICVTGGILSKANRTQGFWWNVANDVRAAIAESDGQLSDILSLSYNHLPSHLRPCFLYMGIFPEDYEIKASRLIRLWVAEGFLKPNGDNKSLEEEAEACLKALVDRNLLSVKVANYIGRAKSYSMHDMMRDLCLKKVEQHRFVHISKKQGGRQVEVIRRMGIHSFIYDTKAFCASKSMSLARSFLCTCCTRDRIPSYVLLGLRLLRVLDLLEIDFRHFPTEILQILNLRYLAVCCTASRHLPSGISRLCNLQTLVISGYFGPSFSLPCEILQMAELRHVLVYGATIFFQFRDGSDWEGFTLDKLQTLLYVRPSHEFLHRIPNVKKLGIRDSSSILDLYHLHKLETLRFSCGYDSVIISPLMLRLPPSLKKLSLTNCKLVGEFMNYLCELPNLEVLKLILCEFEDGEPEEWDATEQEFCKLHFLLLERLRLVHWQADETNFPRLRHLVIRECHALKEIPSDIGEIPTLQTIELYRYSSSPSLVASAKLIIKEQRDNGNVELQLRM